MLRYDSDGNLIKANLESIAAVTEEDIDRFLTIAELNGEGYGYTSGYKYRVVQTGEERYMVVFLDCHSEMRSTMTTAIISIAAAAVCIALAYVAVVLFSRKAVDPVVRASERQKQFITDAGHEIKTPLAIIGAANDVIELDNGESEWTQSIRNQVKRLSSLTEKLVMLSKMDEERTKLVKKEFNLSDAVTETASSFSAVAAAKNKNDAALALLEKE